MLILLHDRVAFGSRLPEDEDDGDAGREDDGRRDDADEQLRQREGERSDVDGRHVLRVAVGAEEHAVGDHCEEEQRDAAADALDAREVAAGRATHHRHPHVVVGELLAHRRLEEVGEGGEVVEPGDGQDALHRAVVLLHRQPAVTEEEEPATRARGESEDRGGHVAPSSSSTASRRLQRKKNLRHEEECRVKTVVDTARRRTVAAVIVVMSLVHSVAYKCFYRCRLRIYGRCGIFSFRSYRCILEYSCVLRVCGCASGRIR